MGFHAHGLLLMIVDKIHVVYTAVLRPSESGYNTAMESTKYIYWQDRGQWLGYLQDYPDYWTQGESLEDLQAHLRDLYRDLTSSEIPGVRKLAELTLQ